METILNNGQQGATPVIRKRSQREMGRLHPGEHFPDEFMISAAIYI